MYRINRYQKVASDRVLVKGRASGAPNQGARAAFASPPLRYVAGQVPCRRGSRCHCSEPPARVRGRVERRTRVRAVPLPLKTIADLAALGADAHAELIDGVLHERPLTTVAHSRIVGLLMVELGPTLPARPRRAGRLVDPGRERFRRERPGVFRPDALGWQKKRLRQQPGAGRVEVVPDGRLVARRGGLILAQNKRPIRNLM
jgi:hypothetical protein